MVIKSQIFVILILMPNMQRRRDMLNRVKTIRLKTQCSFHQKDVTQGRN